MVVGIFIFPTVSFSQTFDLPAPVYVSGDASGKIFLKSDNPASLDMITGAIQFHNDIMKSRGWGMTKNAFRPAERVSPNLLTIQLYERTLKTQFSFNIKSGAFWGLIPSCNLIPDPKSVIIEYSGPSRDSEDGNGGHHFSLIAHITDASYYKAVGNIMPCPDEILPASAIPIPIIQAPAPAPTPALPAVIQEEEILPAPAKPTPVPAPVAKKPIPVKKPRVEKCDPCPEIKKVQEAVGEATPEEKTANLGDLHKKATRNIEVAEKNQDAITEVGKRIGEPAKGETIMGVLNDIQKKVTPPPIKPLQERLKDLWWLCLALTLAFIFYLYRRQRQ